MLLNIFAFTEAGAEPAYISVNNPMPGQADGVTFTVRSPNRSRGGNGNVGEMTLNRKSALELGLALIQATT